MTPQERRVAKQTGRIISSVRKSKGLTQSDVAAQLAVSQSALSKIEHGHLIPSVHQWFEFCKFTGVPVDSHIVGYVDYSLPVRRITDTHEGSYRLPKAYSIERGSTNRTMLPLIKWLEEKEGPKKAEAVLDEMGIDSDYFVQLDHTISPHFGLDLIAYFQKKGYYSHSDVRQMLKPVTERSFHGSLWSGYEQTSDSLEVISLLLSRTKYYEDNFDYFVENQTKKYIDFSSVPGEHFTAVKGLATHEARFSICNHRKVYFEQMSQFGKSKHGRVDELECAFKGAKRCVFRLETAS